MPATADGSARTFSLLIKPASADCNLRCGYCFYRPVERLYPGGPHRMAPEVLERLVATYLATDQPTYGFAWQGGEPSLMGKAFFREVTRLQRLHGRPGATVGNALQTNATLVDDELARHLAQYRFLVGVSLDGPPELHDANRRDVIGAGSHAAVMEGVGRLRRYGVQHNVLVLVSSTNVGHGKEIYQYLVDQGFHHHQYIPCVNLGPGGQPDGHTVSPEAWGTFLREVYDAWHVSDTRRVSIRLFDSIVMRLVDGVANTCSMGRDCRQYFVVEYNGDVYPCDFYVERALHLGNVMTHTWDELGRSPVYTDFGRRKRSFAPRCRACPYLEVCGGDCPRHRQDRSWLCAGWQAFYAHALPGLTAMAKSVRRGRDGSSAAS